MGTNCSGVSIVVVVVNDDADDDIVVGDWSVYRVCCSVYSRNEACRCFFCRQRERVRFVIAFFARI
jgi:hypothetical protein